MRDEPALKEIFKKESHHVAIVGMGPWGQCILRRLLANINTWTHAEEIVVHIFDPAPFAQGVHKSDLPDYLLANTPCGQVTMFADIAVFPDSLPKGPSLYEWVAELNEGALPGRPLNERDVRATDFLSRAVLGEYLQWSYEEIKRAAPANVRIVEHRQIVRKIRQVGDSYLLVDGEQYEIAAAVAFVSTGHGLATLGAGSCEGPSLSGVEIALDETIAIRGLGLTAIDLLMHLTVGRGGLFVPDARTDKMQYRASGLEPKIILFSGSGLPYHSRPDPSQISSVLYEPAFFTSDRVDSIESSLHIGEKLDFRRDLLPLLFIEMRSAYYFRSLQLAEGTHLATQFRERVSSATLDTIEDVFGEVAFAYDQFDPSSLFHGNEFFSESSEGYTEKIYEFLKSDFSRSKQGEKNSPVKAALEICRKLRDGVIRYAVEYGRMSETSSTDFFSHISPKLNRLLVGPPYFRSQQLVALIDAGIVQIPLGRGAISQKLENGVFEIRSLDFEKTVQVKKIYNAFVPRSSLQQLSQSIDKDVDLVMNVPVNLNKEGNPVYKDGDPWERVFIFGADTEGPRYYNSYIPSSGGRFRAFFDADRAVKSARRFLSHSENQ